MFLLVPTCLVSALIRQRLLAFEKTCYTSVRKWGQRHVSIALNMAEKWVTVEHQLISACRLRRNGCASVLLDGREKVALGTT
jgi:hypothetical protein